MKEGRENESHLGTVEEDEMKELLLTIDLSVVMMMECLLFYVPYIRLDNELHWEYGLKILVL